MNGRTEARREVSTGIIGRIKGPDPARRLIRRRPPAGRAPPTVPRRPASRPSTPVRRSAPRRPLGHRRLFLVVALCLALGIILLRGESEANDHRLLWAPPLLSKPTTVEATSGLDPDILRLDRARDYVVKLPRSGLHGALELNGGHNVVLIGGHITVPSGANQTDNGADNTDTALYIRGATGTVHVEGLLLDADRDVMFDGIDINAPRAVVQIENVRMVGVYGSHSTEHADAIQTWGGAKDLRVDRLTADGDYQGLTIAPDVGRIRSAEIHHLDLTADRRPPSLAASTTGGGIMIWLTRGIGTCDASPVTFDDVYVLNRTQRIATSNTVWPPSTSELSCAGHRNGAQMSWPRLPVTGDVNFGSPPSGPFVPDGAAGSGYTTPGYTLGGPHARHRH